MKPLLSLVMIVKDEAGSIQKVLEAVKPHIDQWTIVDTGSIDGTQDIIREILSDVTGNLYEKPFEGYAASRNHALYWDSCKSNKEFQLMLSGDEYLRNGAALREYLETQRNLPAIGAYKLSLVLDGDRISPHRVFRTGSGWHYEDDGLGVHEFATHNDALAAIGAIPREAYIEHIVSDHDRRMSNIWENHIPLLAAQLEERPDNERALIFLANSYKSLFDGFAPGELVTYAMQAMSLYLRRLAINTGTDAERNYVKLCYLDCARLTGVYSDAELYARVEELAKADPHRPETALLRAELATKACSLPVVYGLAAHAAEVAAESSNIENDSPVSTTCCWRAHHLASVAAKQLATKHPEASARAEYARKCAEHARAGMAAGGSEMLFENILEEIATSIPASAA